MSTDAETLSRLHAIIVTHLERAQWAQIKARYESNREQVIRLEAEERALQAVLDEYAERILGRSRA